MTDVFPMTAVFDGKALKCGCGSIMFFWKPSHHLYQCAVCLEERSR